MNVKQLVKGEFVEESNVPGENLLCYHCFPPQIPHDLTFD
jgi:hypothetical protein